jgi:glutamine amidotransferase
MICVIDYDAGNLKSVETALKYLRQDFKVSGHPEEVIKGERLIFPGVGDAGAAMNTLRKSGLKDAICHFFKTGRPVLGICLGAQIILTESEEHKTECLNLISGSARLFPGNMGLKVPHMGWNQVNYEKKHVIFNSIPDGSSYYFVHSYYPDPDDPHAILGRTEYGINFSSIITKDNLMAVQFHPEKSGEVGLKLLENFCVWEP